MAVVDVGAVPDEKGCLPMAADESHHDDGDGKPGGEENRRKHHDDKGGEASVMRGGDGGKKVIHHKVTISAVPDVALLLVVEMVGTPPQDNSGCLGSLNSNTSDRAFLSDLMSMRGVCRRWKGVWRGVVVCGRRCVNGDGPGGDWMRSG